MCLACGWKPEGSGYSDDPIMQYMQNAFEQAMPEMNEGDKLPEEYRERELAALGYIGPAFFYSLLRDGDSELVKYHARQSALLLALHMLSGVIGAVPYVGKPVKKIAAAGLAVLGFIGARNAYFGEKKPVPFAGEIIVKLLEAIK